MFRRNRIVGSPAVNSLVSVWMLDLAVLRPEHDALLNPLERARQQGYRFADDRARFTLGVVLTRLAAGQWLERPPATVTIDRRCARCGRPHGKPQLPGSALHVSASHAGRLVAVALTAAGPVGIDVEHRNGHAPEPRELALSAGEHPEAGAEFTTLWCRKEAVVKATGEGLRAPLSEVVVSAAEEPARLLSYRGSSLSVQLADLETPAGYSAALAVLSDTPLDVRVVPDARRLLDDYRPVRG